MRAALPKPTHGVAPTLVAEALWYHMRGFGTASDRWPKADQIAKTFTSEAAPAFRPPPIPMELPLLTRATQEADEKLMRKQRSYAAPAHILSGFMAELDSATIIPLREALNASVDPRAWQRIEQTIDFLQGRAAAQIGYALRSLAASFNFVALERKDALVKLQSIDIQPALKQEKLGFRKFFHRDVGPITQLAATSAQLRLTQAALSRFPGGGNRGQANKKSGQQHQNNSNANKNSGRNNNNNRGGGGAGGRGRRGGRGRGKGRGGYNANNSNKSVDKE